MCSICQKFIEKGLKYKVDTNTDTDTEKMKLHRRYTKLGDRERREFREYLHEDLNQRRPPSYSQQEKVFYSSNLGTLIKEYQEKSKTYSNKEFGKEFQEWVIKQELEKAQTEFFHIPPDERRGT